jgi:WD40 repeat protein/serine/threonine protein kinase
MSSPSDPDESPGPSTEELFERFLEQHDERDDVAFERLCTAHADRAQELGRLRALWLRLVGAVDGMDGGLPGDLGTASAHAPDAELGDASADITTGRPDDSLDELIARLGEAGSRGKHLAARREIARGGMGRILRTWDRSLRRTLAMKVLLGTRLTGDHGPGDPNERRQLSRFLEEAQITGQLDHPGIVPVHELGIDAEGNVYFTMRLVRGRSLRAVYELVPDGREGWNLTRALGVLLRVCHAVAFAHSKGVIHRDLKPANVMVGRFGETYVMDWGLAKVLGREDTHDLRPREAPETTNVSVVATDRSDLGSDSPESPLMTMDGTVVGTPAYMSPEQAQGHADEVGPQCDVYSVGAMLYHLLAGRMPYVTPGERPSPHAVLAEVRAGPPARVSLFARKAPPELVAICETAMARKVDARYPDLSAMADELLAFLEGRVVRAYSTGALAQLTKWVGRHRLVATAMLSAMAAITTALIFTLDINDDLTSNKRQLEERGIALQSAVDEATSAREATERESEAKDDALAAMDIALEDKGVAVAFADRHRRLAERSSYVASLGAVDGALRNADLSTAQRMLAAGLPELRGWEWQHLALRADPGLATLTAHDSSASAVAFAPGGALVGSVGLDGRLELWDPRDGTNIVGLHDAGFGLSALAFSPDGSTVAAAGWDDRVLRWELESGRRSAPLLLADDSEVVRDGSVTALAYAPDGRTLYAGTDLDHVVAFDSATGARRVIRRLHTGTVTSLAVSSDGRLLVTGSEDHSALVWDAARGEPLQHLFQHDAAVRAVAFSPSAPVVATGSDDGTLAVFDRNNGEILWDASGHVGRVSCLAFSPDGATLVSGSFDRTLRFWDAHSGNPLASLTGHASEVTAVAFDEHGGRLASVGVDGSLHFWDSQDRGGRSTMSGHTGRISGFAVGPDGRLAISAGLDGRLRFWDSEVRLTLALRELSHTGATALALSADGSRLATADGSTGRGRPHHIVIWNVSDPTSPLRLPREVAGHEQAIVALDFSSDGALLASASRDHTLRVWDTESGLLLHALGGHRGQLLSLAFQPERARLVSGGFDESVRLWDTQTGAELVALQRLGSHVGAVSFSADGQLLAIGLGDGGLSLHDAASLDTLHELLGHMGGIASVAFHPDQPRLVSASEDGTIRVWDTDDGAELLVLRPRQPAGRLSFSADGTRLFATVGQDIDVYETTHPGESWELRHDRARLAATAGAKVDALLDRYVDPRLVVLALQDDPELDPLVAADGLRIVRNFGSDPDHLADAAWSVAFDDFTNPPRCRRALRQARAAHRLRPGRARFMSLLGMALHRVGEHAEAMGMFERAWSANIHDHDYPSSWDLYFLAMASWKLGDEQGARQYLAQAQDVTNSGLEADHPATVSFAAEAQRLLR